MACGPYNFVCLCHVFPSFMSSRIRIFTPSNICAFVLSARDSSFVMYVATFKCRCVHA